MSYAIIMKLAAKSGLVGRIFNETNLGQKCVSKAIKNLYGEQVGRIAKDGKRVYVKLGDNHTKIFTCLDGENNVFQQTVQRFNHNNRVVQSSTRGQRKNIESFFQPDFPRQGDSFYNSTSWRMSSTGVPNNVRKVSILNELDGSTREITTEVAKLDQQRGLAEGFISSRVIDKSGNVVKKSVERYAPDARGLFDKLYGV